MDVPNARRNGPNALNVQSKSCAIPKTRRFDESGLDLGRRLSERSWRCPVDDCDRVRGRNSCADRLDFQDDRDERQSEMTMLERVREELAKYEHPFFDFDAREKGEGVEMLIRSRVPNVLSPEYRITLNERDVQSSQFQWTFQKLLYDCL